MEVALSVAGRPQAGVFRQDETRELWVVGPRIVEDGVHPHEAVESESAGSGGHFLGQGGIAFIQVPPRCLRRRRGGGHRGWCLARGRSIRGLRSLGRALGRALGLGGNGRRGLSFEGTPELLQHREDLQVLGLELEDSLLEALDALVLVALRRAAAGNHREQQDHQ